MGLSHPSRGAWIEIPGDRKEYTMKDKSHPSRGAWIEISQRVASSAPAEKVAPLTGCVD